MVSAERRKIYPKKNGEIAQKIGEEAAEKTKESERNIFLIGEEERDSRRRKKKRDFLFYFFLSFFLFCFLSKNSFLLLLYYCLGAVFVTVYINGVRRPQVT